MTGSRLAAVSAAFCAVFCAGEAARALDLSLKDDLPPSAWIVELGGYGVLEPTYLGSKYYNVGFKPLIGFRQAGDKEWLSFPELILRLQSLRNHGFSCRPGRQSHLAEPPSRARHRSAPGQGGRGSPGGAFAEYYPLTFIRTRAELLQGVTGNMGFAVNLSADYIWRPAPDLDSDRWSARTGCQRSICFGLFFDSDRYPKQ